MPIPLEFGRERVTVEIPAERLISLARAEVPTPLADPVQAVRDGLESPLRYPALRRALTPDDHVAIVVDEHLPRLPELLAAVVEYIISAGVEPAAVTLLCPPSRSNQPWLEELPEALEEVHLEVHDPTDRNHLAYLATTRAGRRIYLNRTAVDADQLVVLTGPRLDPMTGYSGGEVALYPALSDAATRASREAAETKGAAGRVEAGEVFWLLGLPFLIQVIEGGGDTVAQVLAGTADTAADGRHWLDRYWQATVAAPADIVIATISGDPARQTLADMARALACAAGVVRTGGVIVLLCETMPVLDDAFRAMQQTDDPEAALKQLRDGPPADSAVARQWLEAVQRGRVFLLSGLPAETAEALFTTPLQNARQVQRLLDAGGSCLVLPDAHKLLVATTQQ